MAGHSRGPNRTSAAMPTPIGGQKAVNAPWMAPESSCG